MNPIAKAVVVASILLCCALMSLFIYGMNVYSNTKNFDSTGKQSIDSTAKQSIDSATKQSINMLFWLLFGLLFERTIASVCSIFYRMYFAKLSQTLFISFNQTSLVFQVFEFVHVVSIIGLSTGFIITCGAIDNTKLNSDNLKLMNLFLKIFMICLCSIFVQIFIIFGGIYLERRYILRREVERALQRAGINGRREAISMFVFDLAIYRNILRTIQIPSPTILAEPEQHVQHEILAELSITTLEGAVEGLTWNGNVGYLEESSV